MEIEFEATFPGIDKDDLRNRLRSAGATLVKPEFLQTREVFQLPKGNEIKGGWIRVRNEGDRITMSLKIVDGENIHDQKEVCVTVDSMEKANSFLTTLGCTRKAYQESKRELWTLGDTEVTIDEWPFLEPFVEVEGKTEEEVKQACEKLNLDYSKALFCSVDTLYNRKYGTPTDWINNNTPEILFDGPNPFIKDQ